MPLECCLFALDVCDEHVLCLGLHGNFVIIIKNTKGSTLSQLITQIYAWSFSESLTLRNGMTNGLRGKLVASWSLEWNSSIDR